MSEVIGVFGVDYCLNDGDIHHSWIGGWITHRLNFLATKLTYLLTYLLTYSVVVLATEGIYIFQNLYVGCTLVLFLVLSSISALTKIVKHNIYKPVIQ